MENPEFDQSPLFNLNNLEIFGFKLSNKSNEWDKYLEEFLLFRYSYFRIFFIEGNIEKLTYFINLMEANFLTFRCELICKSIVNIKKIVDHPNKKDSEKLQEMVPDYLKIINLGRIVIIYFIQLLYNSKIKLSEKNIKKFMKHDLELDSHEPPGIKEKIIKFNFVKSKLPTDGSKIGN